MQPKSDTSPDVNQDKDSVYKGTNFSVTQPQGDPVASNNPNSALPKQADGNSIGSLNIDDKKLVDVAGDKPISDFSNLTVSNTSANDGQKTVKANPLTGQRHWYLVGGMGLLLLAIAAVLTYGTLRVLSSKQQQSSASVLSKLPSAKQISLNVPVNGNQSSVLFDQTNLKTINLNGDVTATGNVTGLSFSGSGSNLTNLNASNLTSGTVNNSRLSSQVTLLGNSIPLTNLQGNVVSSINGVVNNGGNVNIVGDSSISVTPNQSNNSIQLSLGASAGSGTITGVTAGTGLTGGGTSGSVSLSVDNTVTTQGNTFNGSSELVQLTAGGALPVLNAANLTNLDASNISSGTLADARLNSDVTTQGNTFNGASELVQLTNTGILPALDGSNLTNLNASNISLGTLSDSRLSNNVTLQGNTFNGPTELVQLDNAGSLPALNGSQLTNLDADNITAGTLNDLRLSSNVTLQGNTFNGANELITLDNLGYLRAFNASNLTNLNGSAISTGTVSDSRLSSNVALLDASNTFTGSDTFSQPIFANSIQPSSTLTVGASSQTLSLQGNLSSTLVATSGAHTTTIGFSGVPTASTIYNFDTTAPAGTYTICTTANLGTCTSSGGGNVSTTGGNSNKLAVFTGANQIQSSDITDNGSLITLGVNTLVQPAANSTSAFEIQNAAGTSNLFVADTTDGRIGIGTASPGYPLDVNGDINISSGSVYRIGGVPICGIAAQCAPSAGSNFYIQNGTTTQTASNFNIQSASSASIGGIIQGASGQTADLLDLKNSSGTVLASIDASGNINTTGQYKVNGTQISSSNLSDSANLAKLNANNTFTGKFLQQNTTNSTSAFEIQNAAGTSNLFVADTTDGRIGIGTASPGYPLDVNGDINISSGSAYRIGGVAICTSSGCSTTGGSASYIQNGTTTQTGANFNIQSVSSSSIGGIIQGASGQTADLLDLKNSSGTVLASIDASGNINTTGQYKVNGTQISSSNLSDSANLAKLNANQSFTGNNTFTGTFLQQNTTNSTSAFEIQNAAGTSNLFVADTTDGRIGIGTASPGYPLDVNGDINISNGSVYRINGVPICGTAALCAPSANSTFYIQNGTTTQTGANFNIQSVSSSSIGGIIQGASGQTADLLDLKNSSGTVLASIDASGNINTTGQYKVNGTQISSSNLSDSANLAKLNANQSFTGNNTFTGTFLQQNTTNSTSAFEIQNAAGTSNLFVADTTDGYIGIGTASPGYPLDVNGDINISSGSAYRIGGVAICTSSGCSTTGGSASYIQNGTTTQTGANFNIQSVSSSSIGGIIQGASGQTADLLDLKNSSGTVLASIDASGNINTTGQYKVNGTQISSSNLSDSANLAKLNANQSFTGNNTFTGTFLQQNTTNSTSAFEIQNAAGTSNLFVADTTDGYIGIGTASPGYPLDVNGDINVSSGNAYLINGVPICTSGGCTASGGSGSYIQNSTSLQTGANFNIQSVSSSSIGGIIQGASGQTADLLDLKNSSGTVLASIDASGNINTTGQYKVNGTQISSSNLSDSANLAKLNANQSFTGNNTFTGTFLQQNTTNSTSAFEIQNAAGTSNLFVADTTDGRIGIGTASPGYPLDVNGDINISNGSVYLINGTAICGAGGYCAPASGSANYIQNGTTTQTASNFNIQSASSASIGGIIQGASGQTADLLDLKNSSGTVLASIDASGNINTTGQYKVNGTQISSSNLSDSANLAKLNANNTFTGKFLQQNTTNSTSAFEIQNAAGTSNLFVADTTDGRIGIGTASPAYPLDVNGSVNVSTGNSYLINGTAICGAGGYCAPASGSANYIQNGTTTQTGANFNIQSASSASIGGIIQGASGQTADLLDLKNSSGTVLASIDASGNINTTGQYKVNGTQISSSNLSDSANLAKLNANQSFTGNNTFTGTFLQQNTTNSTSAFEIQNAAGTSNLFVADTTDGRIGIGTASPGYPLDVNGDINIASGDYYRINGTPICGTTTGGSCAPSSGSANYIQNTTSLQTSANFNIQSTNSSSVVGVLNGASGQTADLLDLLDGGGFKVAAFSNEGALTLGSNAGGQTGNIIFQGSGGSGKLILQGPTTPNAGNYTLSIPAITGNANICTDNSVCTGYASSTGGNYIAKNAADTSSASVASGNLLGFTNTGTGASGVLGLTNSGTNSALSVTQTGTSEPSAGQALILANNNTTTPSGNLLALQNKGTSEFSVDTSGDVTANGTYNTNTLTGSALTFGASGTATIQPASGQALTITGHASSAWTTDTGNLTIDATSASNPNLNIGTGAQAKTIQIGTTSTNTGNTQTIGIGNLNAAGTSNVTIGTGLSATAGSTTIQSKGALALGNGVSSSITLDTGGGANTITIGANNATTTIGRNGAALTLNGSNFSVDNSGDITAQGTYNTNTFTSSALSFAAAGTATIQPASGQALNITAHSTSAFTTDTGNLTIDTTAVNGTLNVGTGAQAKTIQIGTINNNAGNTQVIYIGNTNVAGTTNVTIGANSGATDGTTTVESKDSLNLGNAVSSSIVLDTKAGGTISVGQVNATTINVGATGSQATATTTNIGTSTGANQTVAAGSSSSGSQVTLTGGATSVTVANTGETLQTSTNSSTAFKILGANGVRVFDVDTTTNNLLTNPSFSGNTTGWAATGTGASIGYNSTAADTYEGVGSLLLNTSNGTASTGVSVSSFTTANINSTVSANYYFSFYAMLSSSSLNTPTLGVTITGGGSPTCTINSTPTITTSGFQRYYCTFAPNTTNVTAINIVDTASTPAILYIDAAQLTAGSSLTPYDIGQIQLAGLVNTPVTFQAAANSTQALSIDNASGTALLTVDTLNGQVILGSGSNTITFNPTSGGISLSGSARHPKKIVLTPEYAGATLYCGGSSCPSNDIGTMTANYDPSQKENYYQWTTGQGSNQAYDIVVQIPIPSDFAAFNGGSGNTPLTVDVNTSDTTHGTVTGTLLDTGGGSITNWNSCALTPSVTGWITSGAGATSGASCAITTGTWTAGGVATLILQLSSTGGNTKVGDIVLNYYSAY